MNEHKTESILSAARSSLEPTQADRERVHKKVMAALGAAGVVTAASVTAAKATGVTSTGLLSSVTIAKIGIGVLFVGGITALVATMVPVEPEDTTGVVVAAPSHRASHARDGKTDAPESTQVATLTPTPASPALEPPEPAVQEPPSVEEERLTETVERIRAKKLSSSAKTAINRPEELPNDKALLKELFLIKGASAALRDKRPEKTLRILAEYDNEFSEGVMRQERDGLRVLALCDLGRHDEAKNARKRFLKRFPNSPMAVGIRDHCQALDE